ncbi:predicted protein [Enterococcus faecalis ATCC 4200]|nr:predicted protein [Enterococcus faecalis ATCC 4200]
MLARIFYFFLKEFFLVLKSICFVFQFFSFYFYKKRIWDSFFTRISNSFFFILLTNPAHWNIIVIWMNQ